MELPPYHTASIRSVQHRGIAAVSVRIPVRQVPAVFSVYLDQVYAAARSGAIRVDGQNVFVYHGALPDEEADIAFGVGVAGPFASVGAVAYAVVPSGQVAHATHRGAYGRLGETHAAIVAWCASQGRELAGPRWEVYAHQGPNAEQPLTDVSYLLANSP